MTARKGSAEFRLNLNLCEPFAKGSNLWPLWSSRDGVIEGNPGSGVQGVLYSVHQIGIGAVPSSQLPLAYLLQHVVDCTPTCCLRNSNFGEVLEFLNVSRGRQSLIIYHTTNFVS